MLQVYSGSAEGYTTFITPEAYGALQEYGRMWAQHMGRQPRHKDPMFLVTRGLPKRASYMSVRKHATHTTWKGVIMFSTTSTTVGVRSPRCAVRNGIILPGGRQIPYSRIQSQRYARHKDAGTSFCVPVRPCADFQICSRSMQSNLPAGLPRFLCL